MGDSQCGSCEGVRRRGVDVTWEGSMSDETTRVRDEVSRESTAVSRPRRATKGAHAAVSVTTALALALPLFGLAQAISPSPAAAAPNEFCIANDSALPATKSERERVVAQAAAKYFPADQIAMATAIAGAESSWNPTAVNKAARGNYGLWQINSVHKSLLKARDWSNPSDNAWMAYQVWDAADGTTGNARGSWKPWSVYNSGSYKAYLRSSSSSASSQATVCVEATGSAPVTIATWNVLESNAKGRIADGIRELTGKADVFGLQEMGSRSDRATAANAAQGYTMTTDRTAVPIFYRSDKYTAVEQGKVRAFPAGETVERRGGKGTVKTSGKSITWVQLRDNATSETFYVVNTHLLVGAYNSTKAKNNQRRVALYKQQLNALGNLVDSLQINGAAVYVTGDFNVNYSRDASPIEIMSSHGLTPNWQHLDGAATIGKKTRLDYVWSNRAPSEQTVGSKYGSDHSSVFVTYPPSTGVSGTMTPVNGSPEQEIYSMRTITDPSSGQTYLVPIPTGVAGKVLNKALDQVGDRWEYGGDGPNVWDCSGLTAGAWAAAGITLPHQSEAQQRAVKNVKLANAQPGDVLWREGYTAIYLGTVGGKPLVVGAAKSKGSAVVIHTMEDVAAALSPA